MVLHFFFMPFISFSFGGYSPDLDSLSTLLEFHQVKDASQTAREPERSDLEMVQ